MHGDLPQRSKASVPHYNAVVTLGSQNLYKQTTNGLQQPCSILQHGVTTKFVVAVVVGAAFWPARDTRAP
jgi:hypothetical protein